MDDLILIEGKLPQEFEKGWNVHFYGAAVISCPLTVLLLNPLSGYKAVTG